MRRLFALTLILVLAACGTTPSPVPSTSARVSSPTPIVAPAATTAAATAATTAGPSPSPTSVATIATTLPSSRWRTGELFLLSGLRADIRHDEHVDYAKDTCRPRREDLPARATDGVECDLAVGEAERVGAYLFPDDQAARAAYESRLQENGLGWDDDGGCPFGSTTPQTAPVESLPRSACFVNDSGFANLRVFWPGQSVVIGVLGRSGSIRKLGAWSSMLPPEQESSAVSDPWLGGIGEPVPFAACPDVVAPNRVQGPGALTYEGDPGEGEGIWITDAVGDSTRRLAGPSKRNQRYLSTWSPDGRYLAYTINAKSSGEIWVMDPDDGQERRLAKTYAFDFGGEESRAPELAWSPDGRRLAYTVWRIIGAGYDPRYIPSVWLVDVDSGTRSRIAEGVFLDWSPDASRLLIRSSDGLAFPYPGEVKGPIVIHDIDAGSQTQVGHGAYATWSPDCRFVMITGGARQPGVVVLQGIATKPRLVTDGLDASWSPVSDDLAVATHGGQVWRVSVETGDARQLGTGAQPVWSEDGSRVGYVSSAKGEGLVIVRADGSGRLVVASDKYPLGRLSWSPDGRYIVSSHEFTADTCGGPKWGFVIATDGSGVRMLPSPYHAAWRPTDPSPPDELSADKPPKRGEGCGG